MKSLGEKIRNMRKERGWTLQTLGDKTDTSKSYIWAIENGRNKRLSLRKLKKIAQAFEIGIAYFIEDETEKDCEVDSAFFKRYMKEPPEVRKAIREVARIIKEMERSNVEHGNSD